jgi:D-glycero-alpha-D-manno-heptose-7-phosphate kinase
MIITQTPFRISFFGGGTDIPAWFTHEGGQVLSTAIDKYCYVTARDLPRFFDHSIRVAYSTTEMATKPGDIRHPLIRVILEGYALNNIEIHYDSDLPGNSGLGTSSSFGVGLLAAIHGLRGELMAPRELAEKTIHFERDVLQEAGGYQDQIAAAFGGFNHIRFHPDGTWTVRPLTINKDRLASLKDALILCYIPTKRFSGQISLAGDFVKDHHDARLRFMHESVDQGLQILMRGDLDDFGRLMHDAWTYKRQFDRVTNPMIDEVYESARKAGALGGKVLGAGGGGFMALYCPRQRQPEVREALRNLLVVPFDFEPEGVRVIYFRR